MGRRGQHGRRRRRRAGNVACRTSRAGTWCSSRRRTRRGWGRWPRRWSQAHEADPHRRRHRADGVDPVDPVLIRLFTRQGFGHEIREDGPPSHHKKRGTPSMGGVAILAGIWAGYLGTHLVGLALDGQGPSASGLLVLGLATALGIVGFIDDLIKIRRSRNLGLNKTAKTVGSCWPPCCSACLHCSSATPTGSPRAAPNCPTYAKSPR